MSPRQSMARVVAVGALVVSAGASLHASSTPAHASAQASATYTIAVSLPFNELAELANGIRNAVTVAVDQANASHLVAGVTFKVSSLDDTINGQHDGGKDQQNALQFIGDSTVIGEVGPLNSSAAKVSMPTYNKAGLVQISPSNTNPDLTATAFRAKYEPTTASSHAPITYFRTCSTDVYQGRDAALYVKKIGVKSVFVTDNRGTYGIGLANYFKAEAKTLGLNVLGSAELDDQSIASSAQSVAANIAAKKPDLVYFGGEYGSKGGAEILADDLRKAGLKNVIFMGGDGIFAQDFINGSSSGGATSALATNVGRDITTDPNAKAFVKAEGKYFPGTKPAAYDGYAYDAALVIIRAFARAVHSGQIKVGDAMSTSNRLVVARQVAATSDLIGSTGKLGFDANGDSSNHLFSVYRVTGSGKSAHWKFAAIAPQQ